MDAPRRRPARLAAAVAAALAVTGGVVVTQVAGAPAAGAATLERFGSCEELVGWYREAALEQVGAWGAGQGGPAVLEAMAAGGEDSAGGAAESAAADGTARTGEAVGSSGTGTNVQEEGVDEPAPVKLDGGLAMTVSGPDLVVVDTARGEVLGRVALGPGGPEQDRWYSDLLLVGDRAVVLGSGSVEQGGGGPGGGADAGPGVASWPVWQPTATATVVDVADPTAPRVLETVEVEGSTVSARAVDGVVRLVVTSTPQLRLTDPWTVAQEGGTGGDDRDVAVAPDGPGEAAEEEAERRNRATVAAAGTETWLPGLVTRDGSGEVVDRVPLACEDVHHPDAGAGLGTLTVLTLDPAGTQPLTGTTAVSADGSYVHATPERLYVATTRGGWLWGWPGAVSDVVGAPAPEDPTTQLHGFDLSDRDDVAYLGSGEVDGWLLGQWALDATDGTLRVGTTSEAAEVGTSSSVVVLEETGDGLVEVGRVDGLGPGEQIRSLRWFDDLAVVVTFEQTDPLYTVDLSDPTAPRVLGELKVTGYSGYLHPVGEGMLLGVGQEGDEAGVLTGAKVETYDLRDLAAPTDVDRLVWSGASSTTEQDSRRFAYDPATRTALVPLDRWSSEAYSTGLVAVAVGADGGLTETGEWVYAADGWLQGLATTGGTVVVTGERWASVDPAGGPGGPGAEAGPARTMTVLDARTLVPLAEVDLG